MSNKFTHDSLVQLILPLRLCAGPTLRFLMSDKPAGKVFFCDVQVEPQLSQLGTGDNLTKGSCED